MAVYLAPLSTIAPIHGLGGYNIQFEEEPNAPVSTLSTRVEVGRPAAIGQNPNGRQSQVTGPDQSAINMNILGSAGLGAIQGYFNADQANRNARLSAMQANSRANIAAVRIRTAKQNLYATAQNFEYQAMMQGLQDAQIISTTRARTARRGVRLGVGSAGEVEQTQRQNARINQITIQRNRVSAENQARWAITNAQMEEAQARTDAAIARAGRQNPWLQAGLGAISSFAMADLSWQGRGFNTPLSGLF